MGMTRDEFDALQPQLPLGDDPAVAARQLRDYAIRAAVGAEHLTGRPEWDQFLSYVTRQRDLVLAGRNAVAEQLVTPMVVGVEEVARLRGQAALLSGVLNALEWVLGLPKDIIANGVQAKELKLPDAPA